MWEGEGTCSSLLNNGPGGGKKRFSPSTVRSSFQLFVNRFTVTSSMQRCVSLCLRAQMCWNIHQSWNTQGADRALADRQPCSNLLNREAS